MTRILGVLAVLAALVGTAQATPNGADLKAALVRCADVTYPAPLGACGDDPLTTGRLEVNKNGDVAATLTGAAPGALYDVVLHAANASVQLPVAVLATDAMGNAAIRWVSVFDMGQAGIVAFTLGRNGSVQFVAGFRGRHELEAGLVPCAAINTPAALSGCGADTLKSGKAEIDEGDLKVELSGEPNQSYGVVFRGIGGGADVALGTLTTDKKGKGTLKVKDVVDDHAAGAGNVVLQRDGFDQFITGFQSTRRRPAIVARFQVGLVRCADVNAGAVRRVRLRSARQRRGHHRRQGRRQRPRDGRRRAQHVRGGLRRRRRHERGAGRHADHQSRRQRPPDRARHLPRRRARRRPRDPQA